MPRSWVGSGGTAENVPYFLPWVQKFSWIKLLNSFGWFLEHWIRWLIYGCFVGEQPNLTLSIMLAIPFSIMHILCCCGPKFIHAKSWLLFWDCIYLWDKITSLLFCYSYFMHRFVATLGILNLLPPFLFFFFFAAGTFCCCNCFCAHAFLCR